MKFNNVKKVLLYSFLIGIVFVSGYYFGSKGFNLDTAKFPKVSISRIVPQDKRDVDFNLFWRIWDIVDQSYYDKTKISPQKMVYGAISGMVASLEDPYTAFLPPEENKVVEEDLSGSFEGIGIQIGFKNKDLAVIAPLPNSPAEKAGVKAGDLIVGIIDSSKSIDTMTSGMSLNDAVKIIRGKRGTKVTLVLQRGDSSPVFKKEIERENIDVPSVTLEIIDDPKGKNEKIAHIKLLKFGADTDLEWQKKVNEVVQNKEVNKIILDLRNNPGGYLQGAVDIAGEFMKKDSIVVIEDKGKEKNEFRTNRVGSFTNYKVVILVNAGSASASEILAGALSETMKYKLVGEKTFGKGTIQEPLQLDKGSSLHITTAKWLTPNSNWVHEKGLEPDIVVVDDLETEVDEQLQEAIKILD